MIEDHDDEDQRRCADCGCPHDYCECIDEQAICPNCLGTRADGAGCCECVEPGATA